MIRPSRSTVPLISSLLLAAGMAAPITASAAPDPTGDTVPTADGAAAGTACDPSATEFVPVLQIDLPEEANWADETPPYGFDDTEAVSGGFDRLGYCLEITGPNGPQWVWTAMEAFTTDVSRIGIPTTAGQVVRQRVDDLEVQSNVPGVVTGPGQHGYLEMWPNTYSTTASAQVANASPQTYDSDDSPTFGRHGSFQVHSVGASMTSGQSPRPVLAVNTFATNGALSLGIGLSPDGHPDWTFANNAPRMTERRLTVFARPSLVTLTAAPQDRQLFPRDADGGATVAVSGEVTDRRVKSLQLKVTSGGTTKTHTQPGRGTFAFSPRITAGLHEYRFELIAVGGGLQRTVGIWDRVVAGDVYVVQGQSNAVAAKYSGSAAGEQSPYLRSYGSSTYDPAVSAADRTWHDATADVWYQSGSVGQWAARLGRRLVDTYGVPVALLNGAHGGRPIDFFQRDDADPDRLDTNYGRLRQRLTAAGVIDDVRGVLWYQGESDGDNADVHVAGFSALLDDWRSEIGAGIGGSAYFTYQVRTAPCGNSTTIATREAQRRLGDTHDVTVLSTTGLSGHDGCHFAWLGGYREMGDQTFAVVARDLHGGPSAGVAPPNPAGAAVSNAAQTEITVRLRSDDPLTVEPGAGADFRIDGTSATVTDVAYRAGGELVLTLSEPAVGATGVSYLAHLRAGPRIMNATGTGLLAFGALPLDPPA